MPEKIDLPYIDPIKDNQHNNQLDELNAFWLYIFPEQKLFRFLFHDIDNIEKTKYANKNKFKKFQHELRRPILFVHGYKSSHTTWNSIVMQLWKQGYRNIFSLALRNFNLGIEFLFEQLDIAICKILSILKEYSHINVISHSLGGIVVRYYIKNYDFSKKGRPNIGYSFTLACPHYGVLNPVKKFKIESFAKKVIDPQIVEIFTPNSSMYNTILEKSQEKNFYYTTMINIQGSLKRYANTDGTFSPKPVADMINIIVHTSHFKINRDNITYDIIQMFLKQEVSIYKIRLVYIKFFNVKSNNFYLYFNIKPEDKNKSTTSQRYPINNDIEIKKEQKEEGFIPDQTLMIYTGYSLIKEQETEQLTISVHLKDPNMMVFKPELLFNQEIKFKLAKNKPCYDFFLLKHDEMFIYLSVLSHTLIHEDYYKTDNNSVSFK